MRALRTSETIINTMFAKWIQSYRDLPMMLNQWANVVRWEMRTRLFLRTTEFLWQEGHTCHATPDEAEAMAQKRLRVYQSFAEEVLAIPVIAGLKSDSEKFAGALRTYTIEAMMQDGKALQAGTSHNLSTNFAKAFDTKFLDRDNTQKFTHQTSWGVSTRLIGGMVMTHSDDKGLVLPPRLAQTHVVIIPVGIGKDPVVTARVIEAAESLGKSIRDACRKSDLPYATGVLVDKDETKQAGWKFHEYELIGIPLRVEIGPKDLEKNQVVLTRRDEGQKQFIPISEVSEKVPLFLAQMQIDLLEKARKHRDGNIHSVQNYAEFKKLLEEKGGFYKAAWCGTRDSEDLVKEETKATIRCFVLDENLKPIKTNEPCMVTGKTGDNWLVYFARSY
jgi:prolyl-tRNA synthetase